MGGSVVMVRIYLTEGQHQFERLLAWLHDEAKVCGVTAFRGIAGFGRSGKIHSAHLIDTSLDLPLVIEFFEVSEKFEALWPELNQRVPEGHMVYWEAHVNADTGLC